jgi:hypothetical protein
VEGQQQGVEQVQAGHKNCMCEACLCANARSCTCTCTSSWDASHKIHVHLPHHVQQCELSKPKLAKRSAYTEAQQCTASTAAPHMH